MTDISSNATTTRATDAVKSGVQPIAITSKINLATASLVATLAIQYKHATARDRRFPRQTPPVNGHSMPCKRRPRSGGSVLIIGIAAIVLAMPVLAAETAAPALSPDDFQLQDHAGQVVLLDFWASWCKPCAVSLPWMSKLASTYADRGLVVVAVNLDKQLAAADKLLAQLDPHIVVVHDPEGVLARQHDLAGMPSSFLYDRDGKLHEQHVGFLPANADAREQAIMALLETEATPDAN